ncbi:MAG: DUF177 domain-containing protein [Bacteroidaceae bacterium]|nr:DUF177 domain-containing protein [Bacteroidaceae bacterium]
METLTRFEIDLNQAAGADKELRWHIGDTFFGDLDATLIEHGDLDATLRVYRAAGAYRLEFAVTGEVSVPCDRCLEPMRQAIGTRQTRRVACGDMPGDDGDVITVAADDPTLNVAWHLYEVIALAVPIHHVHPEGQCSSDMAELLARHTAQPAAATPAAGAAASPFAALQGLFAPDAAPQPGHHTDNSNT